jgi:GntR family transcriptional regulator
MVGIPAYQRIYDDLAARIRTGEFAPNERLPPEALLAEQYGVARMTVRQAFGRLVDSSFVVRQQGVGTFVAKDPTSRRSLNRLTGFTEDMLSNGLPFETEMLGVEVMVPTAQVARELQINEGARVIAIKRLRRIGGKPASLQCSYLPYGLFPALAREPLTEGSLYRTLEERFDVKLRRAEQRIAAVALAKAEAKLLDVAVGTPALRTERVTMSDQNVRVEFARSWALSAYELTVHLER